MPLQMLLVAALAFGAAVSGALAQAPAAPRVDWPELAALGPHPVGLAEVELVQPNQLDPYQGETEPGRVDRHLRVLIWYPARAADGEPVVYGQTLTGENGKDVPFTISGLAARGAAAATGRFPMILLAHGAGGKPEVLAWMGENLASKGYVVVGPDFADPPYGDQSRCMWPMVRRPLDVAFVAAEAQRRARGGTAPFDHIDPDRVAAIGYSLGGYGVLSGAGAPLDPTLGPATRGILAPYAAGGPRAGELKIQGLKALVGMAPANRMFVPGGSAAITVPTLYMSGDQDALVSHDSVEARFEAQAHAPRYLLTFANAGHALAFSPAPPEMRTSLWDQDWFEDPVWRKDRLNGIEAHFLTAFLDRYVKGDASMDAYLQVSDPDSNAGTWAAPPGTPWESRSPGLPAATLWKGFQRNHASGMRLEYRPAVAP